MLQHCSGANASKPSAKWSKEAASLVDRIGFPEFKEKILRWFPLVGKRVLNLSNGCTGGTQIRTS